jgi:hypothetical protein
MIKCIKHGKIRIICRITLGPKGPLDDAAYDADFAMYYSLFIKEVTRDVSQSEKT